MSLATLLNQPVTVERWADTDERDRYNNPVRAKSSEYDTTGYFEQTEATEVVVDQVTMTSEALLVLPDGTAIDGGDRVRVDGGTFEVLGPPARVRNPRTRSTHHVEARLRAVSTS